MPKNDDKCFRNIQEQVLKNMCDIDALKFGLRVVRTVKTVPELPSDVEVGDAVAVGEHEPFYFYIKTANPKTYVNVGTLAGPEGQEGPEGLQGPRGVKGSQWYSGYNDPNLDMNPLEGDMYLNTTTGELYQFRDRWDLITTIRGPQGTIGQKGDRGPVGPKGDTGPQGEVGPAIRILGTVATVDDLPNPVFLDRNSAYLVGITNPYKIYVIVGVSTVRWLELGNFTNIAFGNTSNTAYEGNQGQKNRDDIATNSTKITALEETVNDVQMGLTDKVDKISEHEKVYATNGLGDQISIQYNEYPYGSDIVLRTQDGRVKGFNPTENNDLATKEYVDNSLKGIVIDVIGDLDKFKTQGVYTIIWKQIVGPDVHNTTTMHLMVFKAYENGKEVLHQVRTSKDGYWERILNDDNITWKEWEKEIYSVNGVTKYHNSHKKEFLKGSIVYFENVYTPDYAKAGNYVALLNTSETPLAHPEYWLELVPALQDKGIGQATESALGGIKASPKTDNETAEVKIDTASGKLFAPAGGGSGDGVKIDRLWEGNKQIFPTSYTDSYPPGLTQTIMKSYKVIYFLFKITIQLNAGFEYLIVKVINADNYRRSAMATTRTYIMPGKDIYYRTDDMMYPISPKLIHLNQNDATLNTAQIDKSYNLGIYGVK